MHIFVHFTHVVVLSNVSSKLRLELVGTDGGLPCFFTIFVLQKTWLQAVVVKAGALHVILTRVGALRGSWVIHWPSDSRNLGAV